MDLLKELIRDLVGIIFPGSILITFIMVGAWVFSFLFEPDLIEQSSLSSLQFSIIIFFFVAASYIAGQYLRMKTLTEIEYEGTEKYRAKQQLRIQKEDKTKQLDFEEQKKRLEELARTYFKHHGQLNKVKEATKEIVFWSRYYGKWEFFPYPYEIFKRRLLFKPYHYNTFFQRFVDNGNLRMEHDHYFVNFCKVVVFKFSPDLKDEILRKESLVRLMAGMYYVAKFGRRLAITLATMYLIFSILGYWFIEASLSTSYQNLLQYSPFIVLINLVLIICLNSLKREIIEKDRLRTMRQAEVELVYDSFYTVCTTEDKLKNLDLSDPKI